MKHIFISYKREDSQCVLKIARLLEGSGYKVWIDVDSIPGGEDWAVEIAKGVADAWLTLVFWSSSAAKSDYVRQEYEMAIQKKMQNPNDERRIIPVVLEDMKLNPLPELLSGYNAVSMTNCSKSEFTELLSQIQRKKHFRQRQFLPFDKSLPFADQESVTQLSLPNLVQLPFMTSVHCRADLIASPNSKLSDILNTSKPSLQVLTQFMFGVNDIMLIKQVKQTIDDLSEDIPFMLLHITGPIAGGNHALGDSINGFWKGQWLDAVNTTYEAIYRLVGLGGATIQLFNAVPASINFATGLKFYKHWHFQLFHRSNQDKLYRLVLDTEDLDLQQ